MDTVHLMIDSKGNGNRHAIVRSQGMMGHEKAHRGSPLIQDREEQDPQDLLSNQDAHAYRESNPAAVAVHGVAAVHGALHGAVHSAVLLQAVEHPAGNLHTEDKGMQSVSLLLVNMPEHCWSLVCCTGLACIVLFLSKVSFGESCEDMSFYQAAPIAVLWSALGISLILFNKFLFLPTGYGFNFPYVVFLMWWQQLAGTIATIIIRFVRPALMPAATADTGLTWKSYCVNVLPIGAMQAASLTFSNTAYLHISVAYIQMVKNTTAAIVFMFSIMLGLEKGSISKTVAVVLVVVGLLMTTVGELEFAWLGFALQMSATLCDSLRLCMTQVVMSSQFGVRLDPMSALYFFSPTMLVILSVPMYFVDLPHLTMMKIWEMKFVLATNALLAIGLNMTSMVFMKRCGATTYAVTGVTKDVALIFVCTELFNHPVTALQSIGLVVSLGGFLLYNKLKSDPLYIMRKYPTLFNTPLNEPAPTC